MSRMNITANSGLTIQYLTIIHCTINITKTKHPPIWSINPSILSLNTKDDKLYHPHP